MSNVATAKKITQKWSQTADSYVKCYEPSCLVAGRFRLNCMRFQFQDTPVKVLETRPGALWSFSAPAGRVGHCRRIVRKYPGNTFWPHGRRSSFTTRIVLLIVTSPTCVSVMPKLQPCPPRGLLCSGAWCSCRFYAMGHSKDSPFTTIVELLHPEEDAQALRTRF
jgi:hypothetical protein